MPSLASSNQAGSGRDRSDAFLGSQDMVTSVAHGLYRAVTSFTT